MNIASDCIKMYLMVKFNKNIDHISENDLLSITSVPISGNSKNIFFGDLFKFKNLVELNVDGVNLKNEDLNIISRLKIKSLSLYRCSFESYEFLRHLKDIEQLHIISPINTQPLNIQLINNNLFELVMEDCVVDNFESLISFENLKILSVLKTIMPDNYIDVINKLKSLEVLFISSGYDVSNRKNKQLIVYNSYASFMYDDYSDFSPNRLN